MPAPTNSHPARSGQRALHGALAVLCAACAGAGPAPRVDGDLAAQRVRFTGRTVRDAAGAWLGWQGAGVVAAVRGPRIAVRLRPASTAVYLQPVLDGVALERLRLDPGPDRTVVLASDLSAGAHRVELYRDTEGILPPVAFLGFAEGALDPAPPGNGRLLEIVGDSISAGYGNLGTETHPGWKTVGGCTGASENSSWYRTYGALAGRALSAEVSTLALAGWGLSKDNANRRENLLGKVYGRALGAREPAPWSFERPPQAVVVNLGTNDLAYGLDRAGYVRAGLDLVAQVRAHAPAAWIVFTVGSMRDEPTLAPVKAAQQEIVDRLRAGGDARVERLDLGVEPLGANGELPTGCQYHPGAADHERMAAILTAHLRARLGW